MKCHKKIQKKSKKGNETHFTRINITLPLSFMTEKRNIWGTVEQRGFHKDKFIVDGQEK